MQLLGILLILINVGAIAGPLAGVVIVYRDNLEEMVVPPEVKEIVDNTMTVFTSGNPSSNPDNPSNPDDTETVSFQLPQYVSSSYDPVARTITATFNFTNPLNFTMTINAVSADVKCHAHGVLLGNAAITNAVEIPPTETRDITVTFVWTETAQQHFLEEHVGQTSINADLVNITVNLSGISIETPETYNVDIPLC